MSRRSPLHALVVTAATLAVAVGCSPASATAPLPDLVAESRAAGLELTNPSVAPAFYSIMGSSLVPVALPSFCVAGPDCPTVPAGGQVVVPWSGILASSSEREYTILWWRAKRDERGATTVDQVRRVILAR